MFAAMLQDKAPLVRIIDRAVRHSEHGRLRGELIVDLLRARHTDAEAERQFNIAMTWGRYGELFDYDADDDIITVDAANPANAIRPAGEASGNGLSWPVSANCRNGNNDQPDSGTDRRRIAKEES